MIYHNPVLLKESIEGLSINPEGIYVDVTYGGGGHSVEILKKLTTGRLIAFDQDEDAVINNKIDDSRFELVNQNFRYLKNYLRMLGIEKVDGIIADLGISSHQIDEPERGFSTRFNAELDLRMDKKNPQKAKDIINNCTVEELNQIFSEYGELKNAYKIALSIDAKRKINPINTVDQLKDTIKHLSIRGKENKFFAQVFQALRIKVNEELKSLKEMILQATDVLKSGGMLVVISYHSLEDRLIKHFMKSGNFEGDLIKDFYGNIISPFIVISRKAIVPSVEEIERNSRSRSAKLRIAKKV